MNIRMSVILALLALLVGLSGCVGSPYYGGAKARDSDYDVRVVFSDHDRIVIRDYYRSYYRSLPPGLAKKGKIPPGHMYKLRRHQGIPHDVVWQYLPAHVERRLSRLPDGYVRVVIGADVGILHTRTRVVLDVIEDLHN